MPIIGYVQNNAGTGKPQRVITMDHDDALANDITEYAANKCNEAGRTQECDELRKVPSRNPMGSAADGTNLPGDMEPQS
jgi:hypothetical protein